MLNVVWLGFILLTGVNYLAQVKALIIKALIPPKKFLTRFPVIHIINV